MFLSLIKIYCIYTLFSFNVIHTLVLIIFLFQCVSSIVFIHLSPFSHVHSVHPHQEPIRDDQGSLPATHSVVAACVSVGAPHHPCWPRGRTLGTVGEWSWVLRVASAGSVHRLVSLPPDPRSDLPRCQRRIASTVGLAAWGISPRLPASLHILFPCLRLPHPSATSLSLLRSLFKPIRFPNHRACQSTTIIKSSTHVCILTYTIISYSFIYG